MSPGPLSWVTLTTCSSTPCSDQKSPPWALNPPRLCPGAHSPLAWPVPLTAPAGSPGAPTTRGRLSALSWGGLRGVRFKKQQVLVGPPTHSTAASTRLPTSFLWMGPGWVQGPTVHPRSHLIPVLPTGKSLSYSACFTERVLIHTPLPGAQGSGGQAPPWIWGSGTLQGSAPFSSALILQAGCIYLGLSNPCPETFHPLHLPRRLIAPCP